MTRSMTMKNAPHPYLIMHAFFLPWTRDVDEVLSPFRSAYVMQNSIHLLIVHQGHYRGLMGMAAIRFMTTIVRWESTVHLWFTLDAATGAPTFSTSLFCRTSAAMGYGRCSCYHPLVHTDCWSGMSFWLLSDIRSSIN